MSSFKLSKNAEALLQSLQHMDAETLEWYSDMGMGIASTMESITDRIENPPKKLSKGCQVIYLGSELFLPMRALKNNLEAGALTLEEYVKELDLIVDKLDQIVFENKPVLANSKVRNHMKQLANAIILHLEGGPIMNAMFTFLEDNLPSE